MLGALGRRVLAQSTEPSLNVARVLCVKIKSNNDEHAVLNQLVSSDIIIRDSAYICLHMLAHMPP